MANLQGQDINTQARRFLNELSPNGRYSDTEMWSYVDLAQVQVMLDVEWPEATYTQTTDGVHWGPGTEANLPELTSILRVYVNGQAIVPTTIPLLEGDTLGLYDMSTPSTFQPKWNNQAFTAYPVGTANQCYPDNVAMPFHVSQRPRYYLRGGAMGIVPPPTAGWKVSMDVYPAITPVATAATPATATTFFPFMFKEALSIQTAKYALFAEGSKAGAAAMQLADAMYERAKARLVAWKGKLVQGLPNAPVVVPHRTFQTGPFKGPQSGFRMGS